MPLIDPVTMASPAGKAAKDIETTTHAVPTLSSPVAQGGRHVHSVLLLSLFLLRFDALVSKPVATMWSSLPVVVAIQTAYVVLCLPAAGAPDVKASKKLRPGEKKRPVDHTGPNIVVVSMPCLVLCVSII